MRILRTPCSDLGKRSALFSNTYEYNDVSQPIECYTLADHSNIAIAKFEISILFFLLLIGKNTNITIT